MKPFRLPMPGVVHRFVEVFTAAALQAGAVARRLQGEVENRGKRGSSAESSALSTADLAAQDVILLRLAECFPGAALDAEEETQTTRLFAPPAPGRPLIVLDPIDGSLNYLAGRAEYAVMGALIHEGLYRASVIHFPVWEETYWAVRGGGCFVSRGAGGRAETVRIGSAPAQILVPPKTPEAVCRRLRELGPEVVLSRCSAIDASAPALQQAIGSANIAHPDRRRAIGFLLVTEAGGTVHFEEGPWRGEDPEAEGFRGTAHALADSETLARRLLVTALG